MSGLESLVAQRRLQSEEELLEFQRRFQAGEAGASSTKVVRAVRKPKTADAAPGAEVHVGPDAHRAATSDAATAAPASTATACAAAAPSASSTAAPTANASSLNNNSSSSSSATAAADAAPPSRKTVSFEPSADPSLLFRTGGAGVAERVAVAAPRVAFGAGSVAAKKTGFPAPFKADLQHATTATQNAAPQDSSAAAAPVKKKSLFAQQRDRMLAQQAAAAAAAGTSTAPPAIAAAPMPSAPVVQREVVSLSSAPATAAASLPMRNATPAASPSALVAPATATTRASAAAKDSSLPESKGIHEENLLKLGEMSATEIAEAQRELEKNLPPELVAMLRARRGGGGAAASSTAGTAPSSAPRPAAFQSALPDASYPTPQQLNEYLLDESLLGADVDSDDDDDGRSRSDEDEDAGLDEHGERVTGVSQRLRLDQQLEEFSARLESRQALQAQADKLEWSAPVQPSGPIVFPETVQGYDNDAPIWNSWRVDFEGRFIVQGGAGAASSAAATTTEAAELKSKSSAAVVVADEEYADSHNALYHHGDEADRPGYTMRELLHLARSTVMAQRTLSLQVMARVLTRIRAGEYEYPAPVKPTPRALMSAMDALGGGGGEDRAAKIPPFSHLLFSHLLYLNLITLLRLSLDDNRNPAGVLATLHCFSALLYQRPQNEIPLLDAQSSYKGHQMARRFQQEPSLAGEINKKASSSQPQDREDASGVRPEEKSAAADDDGLSDNARDEELCARDLVVGLTHMQLLERIRYILEVYALPAAQYRAFPPSEHAKRSGSSANVASGVTPAADALAGLVLLAPAFQVLLALAQHSPQAASRVFDTPRLKEVVVKIVECLANVVATSSSNSGSGSSSAGAPSSAAAASVGASLPVSSLASALHTALLLLGTLSQVHRDIAFYFVQHQPSQRGGGGSGGIFASIKKFIVLPNGVPGIEPLASGAAGGGASPSGLSDEESLVLLPLSIQALHLWRMCLAYGLDIEAFMDHFPVLLGIVARTAGVVKRAVSVHSSSSTGAAAAAMAERVAELWLRQLRATVSLIEGLTLLFAPMSSSASALAKSESYSAPPSALSFEFSHVVQAVEAALGNLAAMWFAVPGADMSPSLKATMHETLASFLHLFASYYRVLPSQPSFDPVLLRTQIDKHTSMCFESWRASALLVAAETIVDQADSEGLGAMVAAYRASISQSSPPLLFTNLPQSLPTNEARPLVQALNALFGLLQWQESLLTNTPTSSGSAVAGTPQAEAESKAMRSTLHRVLVSSRPLRAKLARHFLSSETASADEHGMNRLTSRRFLLSTLECELLVSLFVMDRLEASAATSNGPAFSPTPLGVFYARVLQSIPALLRNGLQFLASKLLADVVFNAGVLRDLARSGPCIRESVPSDSHQIPLAFTATQAKLLHDLYVSFCWFPEELLVSTLLHTGSLLTPTLCPPVALPSNVVANMDASTGRQFAVELKLKLPQSQAGASSSSPSVSEHVLAAWVLIPLKHTRFLAVQVASSGGGDRSDHSKMGRVMTLSRYLFLLDEVLGLMTPVPRPPPLAPFAHLAHHRPGSHPMATLFLRAFLEFYLLPSEIFADESFAQLAGCFLDRLLARPSVLAEARRMVEPFVGHVGSNSSALAMGASIAQDALGAATMRNQGREVVDMISPEGERAAAASAAAAAASAASNAASSAAAAGPGSSSSSSSSSLPPLVPYFDFHSVTCFVSSSSGSSLGTALWGQSFYPLYKSLLDHFVGDSMGDIAFARIMVLFVQQSYPQDYRLALLRETREMMASLDVGGGGGGVGCGGGSGGGSGSGASLLAAAAEQLPLSALPYLFPLESNSEVLQMHMAALGGAPPTLTRQRNAALYATTLHHVACWLFGWAHVSRKDGDEGAKQEMPAMERVRRIRESMPMSTSPEVIKDLMNYRYDAQKQ